MSEFLTNVTTTTTTTIPTLAQEATSISPLMQSRHRIGSCNSHSKPRPHYLHMVTNANCYRMKANSLPSILDSENDEEEGDVSDDKEDVNKSPTSTASYGKKKPKNKPWRYLQRQRTTEEMTSIDRKQLQQQSNVIEDSVIDETTKDERNGITKVF